MAPHRAQRRVTGEGAPAGSERAAPDPEGWVPFPTVWDSADVQHPSFLTLLGVTDGSVPPLPLSGREVCLFVCLFVLKEVFKRKTKGCR